MARLLGACDSCSSLYACSKRQSQQCVGFVDALPGGDAAAAARLVLSRLAECWTECGPGQLAGRLEAQAVECMAGIVVCYNLLLELLPTVNDGEC